MNSQNNSKMTVPGAKQAIERMKYVGGEITKRLVRLGENQISGSYNSGK